MHFFTSLTTLLLTTALSATTASKLPVVKLEPRGKSSWGSGSGSGSGSGWGSGGDANRPGHHGATCLNQTGVNALVDGYTYLLEYPGGDNFNATANAILSANNFTVQSDSILTLSGRALGQLAYPSKQVYIDTQNLTPPLPSVDTLGVFFTCNEISWRWVATGIGSDELEVRGLIVFEVDTAAVQIVTVYSEFNTAAFQTDLGQ